MDESVIYRSHSCYCPIVQNDVTITTAYDTSNMINHKYVAKYSFCNSLDKCNYRECPIILENSSVTKD